jgi:hypothetical protein
MDVPVVNNYPVRFRVQGEDSHKKEDLVPRPIFGAENIQVIESQNCRRFLKKGGGTGMKDLSRQ